MNTLLEEYKKELRLLLDSGEYDDELINELGTSFIMEYRRRLSGLPYPQVYLGADEYKVQDLRFCIASTARQMCAEYQGAEDE